MGENKSAFLVLGGFVAIVLLLMFGGGGSGTRQLDRSAIGTTGLSLWLGANEVRTDRSHRRITLAEQDVALRILPLYDVDFYTDAPPTPDRRARRGQHSQRDMYGDTYFEKVSYVPSLVMLPKWRTGVIELNLMDEQLLIPARRFQNLLLDMEAGKLQLVRPRDKFLETTDGITLFYPQLFARSSVRGSCKPAIAVPEGVLVAECKNFDSVPYYILSDPDLLNNHGLALGQNAAVALDVITDLAGNGGGTVYIDSSVDVLLVANPEIKREVRPRTVEELSRFLTYPFSLIWLGVALCFLVLLWRGLIRFGPPKRTDEGHVAASKTASIESKGYLLRLAGDDHALLLAYVTDKMNAIAREVMGKHVQLERPKLLKRLHKIAPKTTPQLETTLARMEQMDDQTARADLSRLAETFDETYRRLRDELGHVSQRR